MPQVDLLPRRVDGDKIEINAASSGTIDGWSATFIGHVKLRQAFAQTGRVREATPAWIGSPDISPTPRWSEIAQLSQK